MTQRIVVAFDGGPASDSALRWALEWALGRARSGGASLEITCVIEIVPNPVAPLDYRPGFQELVEEAAERARKAAPDLDISATLRTGDAARALIAASRRADLLVIGSNRAGVLTGLIHGTMALRVAGRSECPTVAVPSGWAPGGEGVVVGWSDDGTADIAVDFAAEEAARLDQPLTIVHSWRPPSSWGVVEETAQSLAIDLEAGAREALVAVASEARRSHPALTVVEHLATGPASDAIVGVSSDAALVVVGSHGRGALGGLIIGSVSHDVLMNMPAPVAVVPHPEEPIEVLPELLDEYLI